MDSIMTVELTAEIVSAYVANNSVPAANLADLVTSVHATLQRLGTSSEPTPLQAPPAVPIKKSITPDYLISLEDGRPYKSLKRHLKTSYGLSPEQYRAKWGLASDYPMVAPNYSAKRSELAKSSGLGQKREAQRGRSRKAAA